MQGFRDLRDCFFAFSKCIFNALYKDVMISLGRNLLSMSPGSYSLACPRDTSSLLRFPVTVVGSLVSGARKAAGFGELYAKHPSSSSAADCNPLDAPSLGSALHYVSPKGHCLRIASPTCTSWPISTIPPRISSCAFVSHSSAEAQQEILPWLLPN